MKAYFGVKALVICLVVLTFESNGQPCDTAMVLPNGHVLIRWCCPTIPTINLFGTSVQRRNELDPTFMEIPRSSCTCPAPKPCSFVDTAISTGVWYYRIREIDLDGTVAFREPMRVEIASLTSVPEEIPTEFTLRQNYPNPFNPSTIINYQIATKGQVTLKVIDVLGQEVVTLVNEVKQPGTYTMQWNATNSASGVYYYRLHAGEFVQTKKLLLLR